MFNVAIGPIMTAWEDPTKANWQIGFAVCVCDKWHRYSACIALVGSLQISFQTSGSLPVGEFDKTKWVVGSVGRWVGGRLPRLQVLLVK